MDKMHVVKQTCNATCMQHARKIVISNASNDHDFKMCFIKNVFCLTI